MTHLKRVFLCFLAIGWLFSCESEQNPTETPPPVDTIVPVDTPEIPAPPPPPPMSEYERTFLDSGLVDVTTLDSQLIVQMMYSTEDNFVGVDVYGTLDKCYLRPEAAEKLLKAQEILHETHPGYNLLLFDCCRPRRVQQKMWDSLQMPFKRNYLAPPWGEGSVHNYGCAVDLSIADSLGNELDMGTAFDFFGKEAQPQLEAAMLAQGKLTQEQLDNRMLLRKTMRKAGFWDIKTEWWHFNAFLTGEVKRRWGIIE